MLKSEPKAYAAAVPTNGQENGQASGQVGSDTSKGDKGKSDNLNSPSSTTPTQPLNKKPLRGIYALGAKTPTELKDKLDEAFRKVEGGWTPDIKLPNPADLRQPERIVLDFGNHDELFDKLGKARKAAGFDNVAAWKALQAQGIFRGCRRQARQGRLPLPGPGQPVQQHGPPAGQCRAGRRRHLQGGRPGHDAHAGQAADILHLCRFHGSRSDEEGGTRPDADGNHPARHAHHGHGNLQAAGRVSASGRTWSWATRWASTAR